MERICYTLCHHKGVGYWTHDVSGDWSVIAHCPNNGKTDSYVLIYSNACDAYKISLNSMLVIYPTRNLGDNKGVQPSMNNVGRMAYADMMKLMKDKP